jgi:hypothetical protein
VGKFIYFRLHFYFSHDDGVLINTALVRPFLFRLLILFLDSISISISIYDQYNTLNHYSVYGMEGNPEFTSRLTKLENYITEMKPRPVQHVHIFTESVVTSVDGPTKLFLDKTSVEQNVSKNEYCTGMIF